MIIRKAGESDLPFLVEVIREAEASGSDRISYRELFGLNDSDLDGLISSMLSEDIEGSGLAPGDFLVAEIDGEAVAACCGWIEAAEGYSSSIAKSQMLLEFLGRDRWNESLDRLKIAAEISIERTPGTFQIESVYTRPGYRGKGLTSKIIECHLSNLASEDGVLFAQIQLMQNNQSAINAYKKAGFEIKQERSSDNPELLNLYPFTSRVLMERKLV